MDPSQPVVLLTGASSGIRRAVALAFNPVCTTRVRFRREFVAIRRIDRSVATEARGIDSWNREEVGTLLRVARQGESRFYPALATAFYTGLRRGELLGLKWEDVDFETRRLHVRRAYVKGRLTSPKSGRGRFVDMAPALGFLLLDVLAVRRRECMTRGWPEVSEWIFPSETNGLWDHDNFERAWRRIRRRAQKEGGRPFKLHCARHTWASLALQAGKSVRWVAEQLGHADPAMTLRVYAHVIPNEEPDLSFLAFCEAERGSKRLYPAVRSQYSSGRSVCLTSGLRETDQAACRQP